MPVIPPARPSTALQRSESQQKISQSATPNPTPAGTDSPLATDRRSTGGMSLGRVSAGTLKSISSHLSPRQQGRLSLVNQYLYQALNSDAAKAMKKALKAELTAIYELHPFEDNTELTPFNEKLIEAAVKNMFKTIEGLPPIHQVELLVNILRTVEDVGKDDAYCEYIVDLKRVTCLKMLVQAALKLHYKDPQQLEALKCLTGDEYMVDDSQDSRWSDTQLSPWDKNDLLTRFVFAERAIQTGGISFAEGLRCIHGLAVSATLDGAEQATIDQESTVLMNLIADEVIKNPSTTLAYEVTAKERLNGEKRLFIDMAMKVIANGKTTESIQIKTKIMQAYAKFNVFDDESKLFTKVNDKDAAFDQEFGNLFFNVELIPAKEGATQAEVTEHINANLSYISAMNIKWFPSVEWPQRFKNIFKMVRNLSEIKNLKIVNCAKLNSMLYDIFEKFKSESECMNVDLPNQTPSTKVMECIATLDSIQTNLQMNMIDRVGEMTEKKVLDDQDVEALVILFGSTLITLFNNQEKQILQEQLFDLVMKTDSHHPQLGHLVSAMVISGPPAVKGRKIKQLTDKIQQVMDSKTTSFYGGAQLLIGFEAQLKKLNPRYPEHIVIPEVEKMMTLHLARRNFRTRVGNPHEKISPLNNYFQKIQDAKNLINSEIISASLIFDGEKLDKLLDKYSVSSNQDVLRGNHQSRLLNEEVNFLEQITKSEKIIKLFENSSEEQKSKILRLLTEGALPPSLFLKVGCSLAEKMSFPELIALVQAVDVMEEENAADIVDFKISPALVFLMFRYLSDAAENHSSGATPEVNAEQLIAQIHVIAKRSMARLRDEKQGTTTHADELEPSPKKARLMESSGNITNS
jgi:hypothetical protein